MTQVLIHKNLVFHRTDRELLLADVYLPKIGKNHPVVLMLHGGAYQAGSKEMYEDWGNYLAEQGYAGIALNYRLATKSYPAYPGLLSDVQAGLDFIVDHANQWRLNPQKIAIMGDSAGAYLATMLALEEGLTSVTIKSVISAYGVFDLLEWAEYTNRTRNDFVVNKLFGYDSFIGKAKYLAASPMSLIDDTLNYFRFDTEFLMIWGEADKVVLPEEQSIKFSRKLTELNIKQEKIIVPDKGHFWFTKNDATQEGSSLKEYPNDEVVPQVLRFLKRTLNQELVTDPTTIKK